MVADIDKRMAKSLVRLSVAALQFQRDAARRNGIAGPSKSQQRVRIVDMEFGHRGLDPDRPLDPTQRLGCLARLQKQNAHHVQSVGVPWRGGENLLVDLPSFGEPSGAMQALAMLKVAIDLPIRVTHRLALTELTRNGEVRDAIGFPTGPWYGLLVAQSDH
jgi:hypothetical protein